MSEEEPVWLEELLQPAFDSMEAASRDGSYIRTGIADLDSLTRGVRTGEVWVVGGLSGAGKSVFAMTLLRACTVRQGRRALLISRRGPAQDIAERLLCAEARVPLHHAAFGTLTDDEWAKLAVRSGELKAAQLQIVVVPNPEPHAVEGHLDVAAAGNGSPVHLVVLDDIAAGVEQPFTLAALRQLARSRNVAIVAVIEEDIERSAQQRRQVEMIADVALTIYREDQHDPTTARAGEMDLLVTRNRRGPVSGIAVAFQGHYARIVDLPN